MVEKWSLSRKVQFDVKSDINCVVELIFENGQHYVGIPDWPVEHYVKLSSFIYCVAALVVINGFSSGFDNPTVKMQALVIL